MTETQIKFETSQECILPLWLKIYNCCFHTNSPSLSHHHLCQQHFSMEIDCTFFFSAQLKNPVTWQTPYTHACTTMTTLRKTNLSANPPTQLASKSLKGCKVLAGLGELSLLHAFTHIVMNEATLGIPDRAQVQQQSHRSQGQG